MDQQPSSNTNNNNESNKNNNESIPNPQQQPNAAAAPRNPHAAAQGAAYRLEQLLNDEEIRPEENNSNDELQTFLRLLSTSLGPNADIDHDRARHMLEACAGNMDLAASLFWEEHVLADGGGGDRRNHDPSSDDEESQNQNRNRLGSRSVRRSRSSEHSSSSSSHRGVGPAAAAADRPAPAAAAAPAGGEDEEERAEEEPIPPDMEVAAGAAQVPPNLPQEDNDDASLQEFFNVSDDDQAAAARLVLPERKRCKSWNERKTNKAFTSSATADNRKRKRKEWEDTASSDSENYLPNEEEEDDYEEDEEEVSKNNGEPLELLWGETLDLVDSDEDVKRIIRIPEHWQEAGLTLSDCKTGPVSPMTNLLETPRPSPGLPRRTPVSMTQYCGGVTALLSLITALLQSGAAIQGKKVSLGKLHQRFADIEDRVKAGHEYEHRLADAIASLLWVAAESVHSEQSRRQRQQKRKKKEKKNRIKSKGGAVERYHRQLCRICTWQADSLDGGNNNRASWRGSSVRVCEAVWTSWTNRNDLRACVVSSMPLFVGPGGCALLLETIIRIHGVTRVERMVKKAGGQTPLIRCWCGGCNPGCMAMKKVIQSCKGAVAGPTLVFGTVGCMSTELLSLLLTGAVHKDFTGWSTGELGIGILSSNGPISSGTDLLTTEDLDAGESSKPSPQTSLVIGSALKNPPKPVWIIRGEKFFSTMWLRNEDDKQYLDDYGAALEMVHWSCADHGEATKFSIVTARKGLALSSWDDKDECAVAFNRELLDQIISNPDDRAIYPDQYKRWRFAFDNKKSDGTDSLGGSNGNHQWTPYFRLEKIQKDAVGLLYAPKINLITWTRWPNAEILLPKGCTFPVL